MREQILTIMKKNVHLIDRYVRWILAVALLAMSYFGVITGVWMWVAIALAAIFLVTGYVLSCPIYMALGISTR
ncbi:MAG: DUF2892 domain-containing protein, partial [Bacteroidota bacterium]|nr:DUF2892 domain-containing protein [Bacteroidota bacterium]MDX5431586.1 DUF2892 domain-containing protein [Bacteroidota bacterium]